MKPAFALSFDDTGITLHHHSDGEWFCVGTVPVDAPDLSDRMQALREQGFALENDLSCKVVIPSDQVKYLTLDAEGFSPEDLDQKVAKTLTSETPYSLAELEFATQQQGDSIRIAAVAKETIEEAHSFAMGHGFIPTTFTANDLESKEGSISEYLLSDAARLTEASADSIESETSPEPTETVPVIPSEPTETTKASPVLEVESTDSEDPAAPTAHPIAGTADPDVFRSPEITSDVPASAGTSTKRPKQLIPLAAAVVAVGVAVGAWTLTGSEGDEAEAISDLSQEETPQEQVVTTTEPQETISPPVPEPETQIALPAETELENVAPDEELELTATDTAILEALNIEPQPVEQVARDPESEEVFYEVTGLAPTPPQAPTAPSLEEPEELYLASIDRSDLSQDAVALPPVESFDTDLPFEQAGQSSVAGTRFEFDDRGLVIPTAEGTLNPDGIVVYLGRPSKVPPEVPVRFETDPDVIEEVDVLADTRPRARPGDLIEQFERQQLGGRSLEELAVLRPKLRPKSLQDTPKVDHTPTALAVVRVPRPKIRPASIAVIASRKASTGTAPLGSTAAVAQSSEEAGTFQPKSVAPKIPTTASVARQATLDNALNLRKLNLIGVYGTPANRRALVRLPSGRYKKLKVGDRVDGGKVIAIGDSELRYQKRGRNVTLKMPRG
ncbi:hypothetical protein [Ruegeria arenilitoris]|uniref:hypothetical protein n=1 Tax=Ruegeria arenilitoris TaxID=1173585 RepID=UPI00147C80D3|nr:hypothetical protein [Ruegeria arenilitoris]